MRGSIIHPAMMERLRPRFFTSLCQITATDPEATPTSFGEPGGTPTVVPGCEAIACSLQRKGRTLSAPESSLATATPAQYQWALLLAGEYPQITERMTATVDGVVYNITGAVRVSCGGFTTLLLERVVP